MDAMENVVKQEVQSVRSEYSYTNICLHLFINNLHLNNSAQFVGGKRNMLYIRLAKTDWGHRDNPWFFKFGEHVGTRRKYI